MNETEIIRQMRGSLETLKEKWREAEGSWAVLDFISAATDETHWMQQVVESELLSNPFLTPEELARYGVEETTK